VNLKNARCNNKERSSVYARCVIGGNDEYSPGQNAELYETQCQTQNVSLTAHHVKTAIRQSECK
jgi:hypothetical protein